jgi:hypothetical protein
MYRDKLSWIDMATQDLTLFFLIEAKSEGAFSDKKASAYRICSGKFEKLLDSRSIQDKLARPFDDLARAI